MLARLIFVVPSFDEKFEITKVIALMDPLNGRNQDVALLNLALNHALERIIGFGRSGFAKPLSLLFFSFAKIMIVISCIMVSKRGEWKLNDIDTYNNQCYNHFIKSYVPLFTKIFYYFSIIVKI